VNTIRRSDLIWAAWLLIFLALEIPAAFGVVPWNTLSGTSWINEHLHPWLRPVLWGFLVGLSTHICFGTNFWKAEGGGIAIALIVHLLWGAAV